MNGSREIWSDRDKATIFLDNVTGINIIKSPAKDSDFVFDWTIEFIQDYSYRTEYGYYCTAEQAMHDASIYAQLCWGGKI